MDLNDIVVFTKVVETKSFTGAAEQLGLPKSTVSRKLAQLEERLGVRLVQRTTRKLALTDIGEAYYERASRIVADLASAEQLVTDMQATPRGRLRVTAPIDLSASYLGGMISEFTAQHPDVNVELDASDRVVDLIEEGFDVAIRVGALPESTLIAKKLTSFTSLLCASPAYLAKKKAPTIPDEIEEHDKVMFFPNARIQSWTLQYGSQAYELARPAKFSSNNLMAVRSAALAGAGVSLLPEFIVACDIHEGKLVRVLPNWQSTSIDVNAVYPARQNLPPRLSLFLEHIAKAMNPPPWTRHERAA
jgi:DNA-binding transcriptional LysR family regulator